MRGTQSRRDQRRDKARVPSSSNHIRSLWLMSMLTNIEIMPNWLPSHQIKLPG